ncbi:MAG TPA: non-ribosomal peptide synthetase [Steroidobacteraceae bacterium]|nr:non-ribosomal peptide synthetase [Steroidobacteraceae bacterium]HQW10290.1 non-ribosomal peptide synthetase [Steroidobacteraceae bacterium]HQZ80277.1 non-ribosomal peptide synthetase [Steroidobacteraceae bacterium]
MSRVETLTELIESNRKVDRALIYLEGEKEERRISYGELYERALGILFHLQKLGARPGDKLILFLNNNEQFLDAYWAGILGGIVPVPVSIGISDEHRHKLLRIARKLGKPFLYTDRKTLERVGQFAAVAGEQALFDGLRARCFLADALDDISRAGSVHRAQPGDTAFIQFSSGSTSAPKGVVLTHANILANGRGAGEAARFGTDDVSLSWMPLTHDMGLIGMHIFMFMHRMNVHLLPTELFIRRPLLWLQLATRKRATILSSPNFGYRHYLKVLGDRSFEDLDLTSVRIIFNGAEPISVDLCEEFLARMEPAGLTRTAMFPVYGLAEASLAVSFPPLGRPYRSICVDRHHMGVGEAPPRVEHTNRDAMELMAVGTAIPYCEVRLVDDTDQAVAQGHIGHILIRGENVTRGYFEDPESNAATITADGWVRTGDLGLFDDGDLYITGRAKEIIFVNGQNYWPHDLESIALRAPRLELGKIVAAGVRPRGAQADQLVVFILHRSDMADFLPTATEVTRLINEHTGLEVAEVVPVKRIPKTTSGKIQRHLLEESYVEGEFAAELAELARLRSEQRTPAAASGSEIEAKIRMICDTELGRPIGLNDNLFEIGASSLKLIAIHEAIDREYPGMIDLTELFDYPTIAELAVFLAGKLAAG